MKNGFAKRLISTMVAICMILTICPVHALAGNEGDPNTITAGQLVADAYSGLSQEEKDLISSGLLADATYEYYVPGEEDELIQVDTENKTVTADSWTDEKGNVWNPVRADIIVNGSPVESITPDGVDSYEYDGNAFSVQVPYEMYLSVDTAVQEQLLNTAGWLKDGIANLDTIAAQNANMGIVETAMPQLVELRDMNIAVGAGTVKLSDEGKAAITAMNEQMAANNGKLTMHAMVLDCLDSSKTEYLLNTGKEMQPELVELIDYVSTLAEALSTLSANVSFLISLGLVDAETGEMISLLSGKVDALEAGLESAAGGDWTAAEKSTALVKSGISADEYAALDALMAALGEVEVKSAEDFEITERFLVAETTIQYNLSMKNITVQVKLEVVEDAVDSDELVSGGETKTVVLTLAEDAAKAEMEAALAAITVEDEAIAAWGHAYVAEHYVRSTTKLPETLTEDITYTITYSPAVYTITYDYDEGTTTKDVPYGYQTKLEVYSDSSKVYDYIVDGEYQPQGSVVAVLGDMTITRAEGKPYTTADLYTTIANMEGVSDKEKAILTAGALQGNTVVINVRYPDTDAGSLVSVDPDTLVLSGKTYLSDYEGLIWVPYSYIVTAGDGTDAVPAYFGKDGDSYTAQIADSNFQEIKVYYRLNLTNLGEDAAQDALDLVAQLVQEAKSQNDALASLSSPNVANNLDMLDAMILDTLEGLINRNALHGDATKDELLKECFTTVINKIKGNCLNASGAPRIGVLIDSYINSGKSLPYYYRNSESFITEVKRLSQYLNEMLAEDANLTADEKLDALAVLIDAVPSSMIPDDKVEEYTQKLPDLQSKMNDINASLLPVNAAVDTTSPNLNKLVNALQMSGTVGAEISDYVYLQSQSFNVAGTGKIILKVNVIYGSDERSVSETVEQNIPVPQAAVDSLKSKVAALRAEMGIVEDSWYWYECAEYADGAALDAMVGEVYATNQILSYTWVQVEKTPCERGDHPGEILPAVEPTCTQTGLTQGEKCSVCGETLVSQQVIPANGHTEQILPAVAPTCTATGLTEGKKCSVCNEILTPQQTVDALSHDFTGEWDKDETGHWHVCLRDCGAIDAVVAHTYNTNNCAEEAYCTFCSYTKEAGQHAWGALECVDDTEHKQVCSSCQTEQKKPHVWTLVDEKNATCEEAGYKKYTCSCSAEKTEVQTKLGHDWSAWTKVDDANHTHVCGNDATHVETVSHTWDSGVLNADGDMVYTCTAECGATKLVIQNKEGKLEAGATIKAKLTPAQDGSVVLPKPEADGFDGPGYRYDYAINGITYKVTNDSESYPIYPGNVADATMKLVNMDNERLELLVQAMGSGVEVEKNPALKPTNDGYYTGIKVEADTNGVMGVVRALVLQEELGTGKYGYVAVGDEPLLNNGKASLLGMLRMMMGADGIYTSQDIIDLGNGTNKTLISSQLVLNATAPSTYAMRRSTATNDGHKLDFQLVLTDTPAEVNKVGKALAKVEDYITFDIKPTYKNGVLVSNGLDIDVKATLPDKVYEIYMVALRLIGEVDFNNANEIEKAVAYRFLEDYVNVLMGADVTTTTLMKTAAKLGKTVDLSGYEDLFNAVRGKLGYGQNITYSADGLSAFVTLTNKNMEAVVDRMEPMVGDAELLDILKSVLMECQDGETVDVTLNAIVTNFGNTNYEAIIVDVGAAKNPGMGKADIFDITEDLAASAAGLKGAAAIMLQKDVTADLHFKNPTILDLNGFTIYGTITADAKLVIIDSTMATATVGGVTGAITGSDVTVMAGTYGTNVSAYLKDGYVQESGIVKNEYYEIVKSGNDITFQVNADILANRDLPSVFLAADMAADLAMNYFTTASLAFANSDDTNYQNPYAIYEVNFDDLVGMISETVDAEKINTIIDILKGSGAGGIEGMVDDLVALLDDPAVEDRINEIMGILKLSGASGIQGFLNDLMAKGMDFATLAQAINGNTALIKYSMATAPWTVKLDRVDSEDYLTVGIVPGEKVYGSVAVTIVGTQENKGKIADVLAELGKIMDPTKNSITVTLEDPTFADRTLTVSGSGKVAINIDMSQNPDYAAITAAALAKNGVNTAEFVDALNAYFADSSDTDALYEALSQVTLAQYISALKGMSMGNSFADMLCDLGVTTGTGNSAAELGDTYRMALVAAGRILARLNIDGNSSVVFGPTGKISYENSDITRNVARTAANITVSGTATMESISVVVKLFTCAHNWGPWTKVDDQTHYRECTIDPAHVETEDHSYTSAVTPPTCGDQGYTTYTCTAECGHSYVADYTTPTGNHTDANGDRICDTCGDSMGSGSRPGGGGGSAKYKIEAAETENGTVTLNTTQASKNTKITITVTPDEGYKVVKVIVTQKGNGAQCDVTAVNETEYTFRMPGDSVTITVVFECNGDETLCPSRHLTDVDRSQWYHIAVDYVVVNHLMGGIGNNLFAPNADMDRAMIVQVLYNQERTPAVEYTGKFSDVPDGKWYTDAIEWGVANHLISGYGDGTFKPERSVSREEIATILYNYAKFKGVDISTRGDLSAFGDGDTVSAWATQFMQWAVGSGLMIGDGTNLYPTQTATRAEVAQMFKNFNEMFGVLN